MSKVEQLKLENIKKSEQVKEFEKASGVTTTQEEESVVDFQNNGTANLQHTDNTDQTGDLEEKVADNPNSGDELQRCITEKVALEEEVENLRKEVEQSKIERESWKSEDVWREKNSELTNEVATLKREIVEYESRLENCLSDAGIRERTNINLNHYVEDLKLVNKNLELEIVKLHGRGNRKGNDVSCCNDNGLDRESTDGSRLQSSEKKESSQNFNVANSEDVVTSSELSKTQENTGIESKMIEEELLSYSRPDITVAEGNEGNEGKIIIARKNNDEKKKQGSSKQLPKKETECKFHMSGWCKFGKDCEYKHSVNSLEPMRKTPQVKGSLYSNYRRSTNLSKKDTPCRFHARGICKYGKECQFKHGTLDRDDRRQEHESFKERRNSKNELEGMKEQMHSLIKETKTMLGKMSQKYEEFQGNKI